MGLSEYLTRAHGSRQSWGPQKQKAAPAFNLIPVPLTRSQNFKTLDSFANSHSLVRHEIPEQMSPRKLLVGLTWEGGGKGVVPRGPSRTRYTDASHCRSAPSAIQAAHIVTHVTPPATAFWSCCRLHSHTRRSRWTGNTAVSSPSRPTTQPRTRCSNRPRT